MKTTNFRGRLQHNFVRENGSASNFYTKFKTKRKWLEPDIAYGNSGVKSDMQHSSSSKELHQRQPQLQWLLLNMAVTEADVKWQTVNHQKNNTRILLIKFWLPVTASLSCFLLLDCQDSVTCYTTVSKCSITLGLFVITLLLLICRAWLYCHVVDIKLTLYACLCIPGISFTFLFFRCV